MKCMYCNAELPQLAAGQGRMRFCPYCGKEQTDAAPNKTIETVVRMIDRQFGEQALSDPDRLLSFFSDLAPEMKREKHLLKCFTGAEGNRRLVSVRSGSQGDRTVAVEQTVQQMQDQFFIEPNAARKICEDFLSALSEPQSQPAKKQRKTAHKNVPGQKAAAECLKSAHVSSEAEMRVSRAEKKSKPTAALPRTELSGTGCFPEMQSLSREFDVTPNSEIMPGFHVKRKKVRRIQILNSLRKAPSDAFDASKNRDGSVLMWIERNQGRFGNVDLYIAGDGGVAAPEDCRNLFSHFTKVESIDFNGCFDTSRVISMESMFCFCEILDHLDMNGFKTSNCQNMSAIFAYCSGLQRLDISNFDTSRVTAMDSMFSMCTSLKELNLTNLNTSRVTDMGCMFLGCESLEILNLTHFNTSSVTDMSGMFAGCLSLSNLDLATFDYSSAVKMKGFISDSGMSNIDVHQLKLPAYKGSLEDLNELPDM